MRRSRSSFELNVALAKASQLTPRPPAVSVGVNRTLDRATLVSFPTAELDRIPSSRGEARTSPLAHSQDLASQALQVPDLSDVTSPGLRCQRFIDWLSSALNTHSAFIADEQGLGLAGAVADAEARLAAAGSCAAALRQFAATVPGEVRSEFAAEVGVDPVCQLIGVSIGTKSYILGLFRSEPLDAERVENVRGAFRNSLSGVLGA